jgi:hypothetical protein
MMIVLVVIWLVRVWIWTKWNPSFVAPETWSVILIMKALMIAIDTFAEGIFYFLFAITGYWFTFFKFQ